MFMTYNQLGNILFNTLYTPNLCYIAFMLCIYMIKCMYITHPNLSDVLRVTVAAAATHCHVDTKINR